MTKLNDAYYDAIVISDKVDPQSMGAVQIQILGVTEKLEVKDQPWALPSVNNIQAVPTKGTNLRIVFDEGDINKPKYVSWSPKKSALPEAFVAQYPNIAVSNLGDDNFIMVHDRAKRETGIIHPSNSSVSWNSLGQLIHDSEKGYNNAGRYGGSNGTKIHSVLTEATIDIFCCTPVGNNTASGGAYQGSEYLFATHMAQNTYDRIVNGVSSTQNENTTSNPIESPSGADSETRDLVAINGDILETIDFIPSPTTIKTVNSNKKRILVGFIGHNDFASTVNASSDASANFNAHYIVGTGPKAQMTDGNSSSNVNAQNKSLGLAQCIDFEFESYYCSNAKFNNANEPANKNTITVVLIGDGSSTTDYQYKEVGAILQNAKYVTGDNAVELYTTNDVVASPAFPTINFDKKKVK